MNLDPGFDNHINAARSFSFTPGTSSLQGAVEATITQGWSANLNAGLSLSGVDQADLPAFNPFPLFHTPATTYSLVPQATPLSFISPTDARAVTVALGSSFTLKGEASGG